MNWYDIEATPDETDGWGIDETEFTTTLNKGSFTSDQLMMAEQMAAEIEGPPAGSRGGRGGGASNYAGDEMGISSAEDAMALRRQQHAKRQAGGGGSFGGGRGGGGGGSGGGSFGSFGGGYSAAPAYSGGGGQQSYGGPLVQQARAAPSRGAAGGQLTMRQKDAQACQFLNGKVQWVRKVLREHGNPSPQMATKFLLNFGDKLKVAFPNPPNAVKKAVVASFQSVGWDVIKRTNMGGTRPPTGAELTSMVENLHGFFQRRTGSSTVGRQQQRSAQQHQQRRGGQQQRTSQHQQQRRGGQQHQQQGRGNAQGSRHQGQQPRRQQRTNQHRNRAGNTANASHGGQGGGTGTQQKYRSRRGRGNTGGQKS